MVHTPAHHPLQGDFTAPAQSHEIRAAIAVGKKSLTRAFIRLSRFSFSDLVSLSLNGGGKTERESERERVSERASERARERERGRERERERERDR